MAVRMPFLRQNPETQIWEYRRKVPDDLRSLVGKREEKKSFATRERKVANQRYAAHHAEVERRWSKLREGVKPLNQKQCEALAGEIYREVVAEDAKPPTGYSMFPLPVRELWFMDVVDGDAPRPKHWGRGSYYDELEMLHGQRLDEFLARRGFVVDSASRKRLLESVQRAVKQAKQLAVKQITEGDYSPDPKAERFPNFEETGGFPLLKLFDDWASKRRPNADTVRAWRANMQKFIAFSGVEDARKVQPQHVRDWRDALHAQGKGGIRIRDGYIAALKAVLSHGFNEGSLETNAAAGVKVTVPKTKRTREPDLNHEEVYIILRASAAAGCQADGRHSEASIRTRRWVPWICAYTGARVAEVTGLSVADVIEEDGHKGIAIKESKNGFARKVPLHPHLLDQGFMDFVARVGEGPLFLTKTKRGNFSDPSTRAEKLAKWVRDIGVIDEEVSPNHGWRHRFRTEARLIKMHEDVMNYLMGHAPGKEGDRYGHIPFAVSAPWISLIPRIDVSGSSLRIERKLPATSVQTLTELLARHLAQAAQRA
jgi:integrase